MTPTIIKPTVGRVVWFHPFESSAESNFARHQDGQPYAAIIAHVHGDRMVNLSVFDANGASHPRTSVALVQDGEPSPRGGFYCEWMPYQKGQAAKTEAAEKATALGNEYRQPSQREQLEYALVSGAASYLAANASEATVIANGIKEALNVLHPQPAAAPKTAMSGAVAAQEVFANLTASAYAGLNAADPLEQEIQAKAEKGPRVTPTDIEAEIASVHYFTGFDGVAGAAYNEASPDGVLRPFSFTAPAALGLLTFCVLVLRNGAKVVGVNYGAIDPAQHSAERGRQEARAQAVDKVYELLGFRLRDELARPVLTDADAAADLAGTPRPT